jgi:hypothetical protein
MNGPLGKEPLLNGLHLIEEWQVTDRIRTALLKTFQGTEERPAQGLEHRVKVEVIPGFKPVFNTHLVPSCRYSSRITMETVINEPVQRERKSIGPKRILSQNALREDMLRSIINSHKRRQVVILVKGINGPNLMICDAQTVRNTQLNESACLTERASASSGRVDNGLHTLLNLCWYSTNRSKMLRLKYLIERTKAFKAPERHFFQPRKELGEPAVCYSDPRGPREWSSCLLRSNPRPQGLADIFQFQNGAMDTAMSHHLGDICNNPVGDTTRNL